MIVPRSSWRSDMSAALGFLNKIRHGSCRVDRGALRVFVTDGPHENRSSLRAIQESRGGGPFFRHLQP